MPFYRYKCKNCGFEFKILQLDGSNETVVCPNCGSKDVQRLLPRVGVVYKGNGYYTTDYRKKKEPAASSSASKPSKSSTSSTGESKE